MNVRGYNALVVGMMVAWVSPGWANPSEPAAPAPAPAPVDVVVDEVVGTMLAQGRARDLVGLMAARMDLNIDDDEGTYEKAQAELVLRQFFSRCKPRVAQLVHQGSSKNTEFLIAKLDSLCGAHRVQMMWGAEGIKTMTFHAE
ncbi:MAG: DUF4783 domain-containing protein [Myxococcota bacterium]